MPAIATRQPRARRPTPTHPAFANVHSLPPFPTTPLELTAAPTRTPRIAAHDNPRLHNDRLQERLPANASRQQSPQKILKAHALWRPGMQLFRQRTRNLQIDHLKLRLPTPLSFRPFPTRLVTAPGTPTCVRYVHKVHALLIGNVEIWSLDKPKAGAALRAAARERHRLTPSVSTSTDNG